MRRLAQGRASEKLGESVLPCGVPADLSKRCLFWHTVLLAKGRARSDRLIFAVNHVSIPHVEPLVGLNQSYQKTKLSCLILFIAHLGA